MSLAKWYHHKADQFARLANDAIELHKRTYHENTRKFWLQLAEQAERGEEILLKSKPK